MQARQERRQRRQQTERIILLAGSLVLLVGIAALLYQIPAVRNRLDWRIETARTFLRSLVQPIHPLPTAFYPVAAAQSTLTASPEPSLTFITTQRPATSTSASATLLPSATATPKPSLTPRRIAPQASLAAPPFEGQDWNNCGPVSLSMYLHYYGWDGDQYDIAAEVKPERADRNVNIDELVTYVYQNVGWLRAIYRVGGDLDLLRELIQAGFPVMVEETMYMEEEYWFNDDRWAGHYLLLTGYDDVHQLFIAQDSFIGPDRQIGYADLDANWQAFNRVYLLLYPPDQEPVVQELLASDWNEDQNRKNALAVSQAETQRSPQNAFSWFNLGSNLLYFERYAEAAQAYDQARQLNLPQRMLRYQFGPFLSYFHAGRNEELLTLADYALSVTPNSEEALLWKGWALYRLGRSAEAVYFFNKALEHRPSYGDAQYALNFVQGQ